MTSTALTTEKVSDVKNIITKIYPQMTRQAFSDFLSTPSPSNGTRGGRGNGRGVGTPTRGRGGGRGGSRKDYSAVPPVDYSLLNKERYQKLDGKSGCCP